MDNTLATLEARLATLNRWHALALGVAAISATLAGALFTFSGWWTGVSRSGVALIGVSSHAAWIWLLFGTNVALVLVMLGLTWNWRRQYVGALYGTWTASASLIPELLPTGHWSKTDGLLHIQIRVINRGPRRWFVREIEWHGQATISVVGGTCGPTPTPIGSGKNAIDGWATWIREFTVPASPQENAAAFRFCLPPGITLWVTPEDSMESFPVVFPDTSIWLPVNA